jgi:hypothetical protein
LTLYKNGVASAFTKMYMGEMAGWGSALSDAVRGTVEANQRAFYPGT